MRGIARYSFRPDTHGLVRHLREEKEWECFRLLPPMSAGKDARGPCRARLFKGITLPHADV
ncbi:hypothetical protein NicSoilB8_36010 [Arthrobacter sp. NicSoilB8]|nr:hypothetical protein NicSoilB8_36010 [Arthrobacter sp. NicSoilB8]